MQGFKALFGCTVYQYIIELKMQTGRRLLFHTDNHINEIAHEVGYQNPQHFIAAFKRKFGISRGKLKN
ncbi:helix-turn-helix transcriptional regulator [uncultured Chryseobacterium sp.]|uniref:helix-turn-helix transcriptional regulator n=1 Tax=uncultured Chryseobacterium sp. TaxID=259322 RepID=UPI0025E7F774|nr:helix-turn-helix transcriptional regulator [uncultured Chryseobacterium sp.]